MYWKYFYSWLSHAWQPQLPFPLNEEENNCHAKLKTLTTNQKTHGTRERWRETVVTRKWFERQHPPPLQLYAVLCSKSKQPRELQQYFNFLWKAGVIIWCKNPPVRTRKLSYQKLRDAGKPDDWKFVQDLHTTQFSRPLKMFQIHAQLFPKCLLTANGSGRQRPVAYFSAKSDPAAEGEPTCFAAVAVAHMASRWIVACHGVTLLVPNAVALYLLEQKESPLSTARLDSACVMRRFWYRLVSSGKPLAHHTAVSRLLDAIRLPKRLALHKCEAHMNKAGLENDILILSLKHQWLKSRGTEAKCIFNSLLLCWDQSLIQFHI